MFFDGDQWCLHFKFIDLVEYLMDFMVSTKRTRAKIVVEPEKRPLFLRIVKFNFHVIFRELFLLFRHLEGAYIPRGPPQTTCVFAAKLV